MKWASEDREAENKEFQMTVADQRATQAILTKALGRLKEFYEARSMLQTGKTQAPAAMTNGDSEGVMIMLNGMIKDAADLEKESLKAEQEALGLDPECTLNELFEGVAKQLSIQHTRVGPDGRTTYIDTKLFTATLKRG